MSLIEQIIIRAKEAPARIVYSEGQDERIISAAEKVLAKGIAKPILIGDEKEIQRVASETNVSLDGIIIQSNKNESIIEKYAASYSKSRGVREAIAKRIVKKKLYFSGMMVKEGDAEGMIAGVASATATVIQAASLTVGFQQGMSTPSSFFVMVIPEFQDEENKILIFADAAVSVQPTAQELAEIAVASGVNTKVLLDIEPKIAFLSFSTNGSARHTDADKVVEAVQIAKDMNTGFEIDGEMQVDTAIVPLVAAKKMPDSSVAGNANVLVFPDLDAGNIGYKLVQYLSGAQAVGPVLQGFAKPVNDMSRGASVEDIISVSAITSVQAQGNG